MSGGGYGIGMIFNALFSGGITLYLSKTALARLFRQLDEIDKKFEKLGKSIEKVSTDMAVAEVKIDDFSKLEELIHDHTTEIATLMERVKRHGTRS